MEKLIKEFKDGQYLTVKVWSTPTGYLGNVIDTVGDSIEVGHVIEIATDNCVDGVLATLGYKSNSGQVKNGHWVWS